MPEHPDHGYPPPITRPTDRYVGVCRQCKCERVLAGTVYTLDSDTDSVWRADLCQACLDDLAAHAQPLVVTPALYREIRYV